MPLEPLPFPINIEKFKPSKKEIKYDCFIYFKSRSKKQLQYIEEFLRERNITFITILCGKYKEEEYLEILNQVKFGIWFGAHESQGFALQEALSMNVPLLVMNVTSLNDEINGEGNHSYLEYKDNYDLSATSTPYWDNRCGIQYYDLNTLEIPLKTMLETYTTFEPRTYVLEHLSPVVCYKRIMAAFDTLLMSAH
jgi:glycosyltransferase involved in cell wall biosynthesis